jgi:hypothetical protein
MRKSLMMLGLLMMIAPCAQATPSVHLDIPQVMVSKHHGPEGVLAGVHVSLFELGRLHALGAGASWARTKEGQNHLVLSVPLDIRVSDWSGKTQSYLGIKFMRDMRTKTNGIGLGFSLGW